MRLFLYVALIVLPVEYAAYIGWLVHRFRHRAYR